MAHSQSVSMNFMFTWLFTACICTCLYSYIFLSLRARAWRPRHTQCHTLPVLFPSFSLSMIKASLSSTSRSLSSLFSTLYASCCHGLSRFPSFHYLCYLLLNLSVIIQFPLQLSLKDKILDKPHPLDKQTWLLTHIYVNQLTPSQYSQDLLLFNTEQTRSNK